MKHISNFIFFILPKFKIQFFLFFIFASIAVILEMLSIATFIPILNLFTSDSTNLFNGKVSFIVDWFQNLKILKYETLIICIIVMVFIFKNSFLIFYQIWQNVFALKIERFLANQLFSKYLRKNMEFYLSIHSGTLIRNMTVEIKNVTKSISSLFLMIIEIFMLFFIITFLFYISPIVTTISLITVGGSGLLIIFFNNKKINTLSKDRAEIDKKYNKNLIDTFNTINEVKLMSKISFFLGLHNTFKDRYIFNAKKFAVINSIPRPLMELIIIISIASIIFFSFSRGVETSTTITTLGLFSIAGLRLLPSISRIIVSFQSLKFRFISFKILLDELSSISDLEIINPSRSKVQNDSLFNKSLNLNNITFNYGEKKIFDSFSFILKKNKFTFICGESGVGKSTLLNLIMGLIKPSNGEILIDGEKNLYENLDEWRNLVGYVPQNIYLLDESLEKNIAFGQKKENINRDLLKKVIKLSNLDVFASENDLSDFKLGEKGKKASGGQVQRIGVARALYKNPSILILDESTNGLDYETEKNFMMDIQKLREKVTVVFVSHRKHIKEYADEFLEIKSSEK